MSLTTESSADEELLSFFRQGKKMLYRKDNIILRGDDNDSGSVFFIEQGFVKAYAINKRGEEYIHVIFNSGDVFPMFTIFSEMRNVFYEALSECVLYRSLRSQVVKELRLNAGFTYGLLRRSAKQTLLYTDRINNLEYKYVKERIVFRLLLLFRRFGVKQADGTYLIDVPMSQQTIAASVNASRESVSRTMESLRSRGLISYGHHYIVVRDIEALLKQLGSTIEGFDELGL